MWNSTRNNPGYPLVSDLYKRFAKLSRTLKATYVCRRHSLASNNVEDINLYLNQDLAKVNEWLVANKLTLNQSKTEFMLIGSR